MDKKIPIFLKGHPLQFEARLKLKGYNPVFAFNFKEKRKKTVIIALSIFELLSLIEILKLKNVKSIRIAVFGNQKEIDFLKNQNLPYEIHKNFVLDIIPTIVNLSAIKLFNPFFDDPIEELENNIEKSKLSRRKRNARHTKRNIKPRNRY